MRKKRQPLSEILQIKITLDKTDPAIWRRVLVPASVSFFDLHHIFQIAMGWTNSHLFEFTVGDYTIGYVDEQLDDQEHVVDANDVALDLLLLKKEFSFSYLYDFGDYWKHTAVVEEILQMGEDRRYPTCVAGEMNCPPEDCGAIHGFYDMLKVIADKKHPEYRETKTWLGKRYDPAKINIEKVNRELQRFRKYRKHWE